MKQSEQVRNRPINHPSELLDASENQKLFHILGKKCTSYASCVAELYLSVGPSHNEWCYACTGVVCLVRDAVRRSRFIVIFSGELDSALWEQEIYCNFNYTSHYPNFHSFEAESSMAALHFASETEGHTFSEAVEKVTTIIESEENKARGKEELLANKGISNIEKKLENSKEQRVTRKNVKRHKAPKERLRTQKKDQTAVTAKTQERVEEVGKHFKMVGRSVRKKYEMEGKQKEVIRMLSQFNLSDKLLQNEDAKDAIYGAFDTYFQGAFNETTGRSERIKVPSSLPPQSNSHSVALPPVPKSPIAKRPENSQSVALPQVPKSPIPKRPENPQSVALPPVPKTPIPKRPENPQSVALPPVLKTPIPNIPENRSYKNVRPSEKSGFPKPPTFQGSIPTLVTKEEHHNLPFRRFPVPPPDSHMPSAPPALPPRLSQKEKHVSQPAPNKAHRAPYSKEKLPPLPSDPIPTAPSNNVAFTSRNNKTGRSSHHIPPLPTVTKPPLLVEANSLHSDSISSRIASSPVSKFALPELSKIHLSSHIQTSEKKPENTNSKLSKQNYSENLMDENVNHDNPNDNGTANETRQQKECQVLSTRTLVSSSSPIEETIAHERFTDSVVEAHPSIPIPPPNPPKFLALTEKAPQEETTGSDTTFTRDALLDSIRVGVKLKQVHTAKQESVICPAMEILASVLNSIAEQTQYSDDEESEYSDEDDGWSD